MCCYDDDCDCHLSENDDEWEDFDHDEDDDEELIDGVGFANPNSALRRATEDNTRIYPCPTCGEPNRLTPLDVEQHYQCDDCADAAEMGF
jgi:hypothetical protein